VKIILSVSCFVGLTSFAQDTVIPAVITSVLDLPLNIYASQPYWGNYTQGPPMIAYSAVRPSEKDSVPLHLMKRDTTYNWIDPPWNPWTPYDYHWHFFDPQLYTITMFTWAPACGETYHDNGQLSSSIACVDSVLHGKAIYWDETGHKTHEYTYFEGHMIKSKQYDDRGRISSVHHYDYSGNQDGVCITYDYENNLKYVSNYKHGKLHGANETYTNGMLTTSEEYSENEKIARKEFNLDGNLILVETYKNGHTLESKQFNLSGTLIRHLKGNEHGDIEFSRVYDDNKTLIFENTYLDGKPTGVWLTYHDVNSKIKHLEYYENGFKVRYEDRKNDQILTTIEYTKGVADKQITYFENGDSAFYKLFNEDGETGYEKKWNPNVRGVVQHEFYTTKDSLLGTIFTGEGFYMNYDTLYTYEIVNAPWQCTQKRYVIWQGDTVRQDYCQNNPNYMANTEIYCLNKFTFDAYRNDWVKFGRWTVYENNNLVKVENYEMGYLHGRVVYYSSIEDSVFVSEIGFYYYGKKTGEWVTNTDSAIYKTNYANDLREGKSFICNLHGDTLALTIYTYHNDTLNGVYTEYQPSNKFAIKVLGNYKDGLKDGEWLFFFENGQGNIRGYYKDGIPVGKWYEHRYNKKGKMKAYRIERPESDLLPLSIEENRLPA
jgi:antitoxin component YwqK of YwqJK toxin-antitoxin module